jgi:pentatricopeptide repeat protein
MAAAAVFSAGRRLLSTTAVEAKTEHTVPIAHLRRLARAGSLDEIDAFLAPLFPSHPLATLSALSTVGLPDRASALLATVQSPTAAHLNAVLGPLIRRRRLAALVPNILAEHPTAPRDAVTDSILAKSLCVTSGADSALHLIREPSSGAAPSVQLFTSIIDSFYKQRLPHRAEEMWRSMVEDHGITPDTAAYNARITYKSTNGTVEEVQELIRAMREDAGLRPDAVTYGGLMRAMARHGRVDEALEVYRRLEKGEEAGVVPGCSTYTFVVGMLCGVGRWSEAEDVFYEGVKHRKVSDLGTVRELVCGLKDADKGRAARRVVVGLRKKFPDQFDGPWKELEEMIVQPASGKEDGDEEEGGDQELAAA